MGINHIAIIPDGNRRWAKSKHLPSAAGHRKGAERVKEIVAQSIALGVPYLTIWGGSYENLTCRSAIEVRQLDKIYRLMAEDLIKTAPEWLYNTRIKFLGEWPKLLSTETKKSFVSLETQTEENQEHRLSLLIGYSGDREMIEAINSIIKSGDKKVDDIKIKQHLFTKDVPPVDLLIRTGGEPHLSSGFMMWDTRNVELYFSHKLWPDFDKNDLAEAVAYFEQRQRRFGK